MYVHTHKCIYMYTSVYVCTYTGAWISQTHLGTHTAGEHYLMAVWSDGNFHLSLQLVLQLRVQTPKWPSESRGVGSLLTQHSLCTGGLILSHQPQPPNQSPQSPPERSYSSLQAEFTKLLCHHCTFRAVSHTHTQLCCPAAAHHSPCLALTQQPWHSHFSQALICPLPRTETSTPSKNSTSGEYTPGSATRGYHLISRAHSTPKFT